MKLSISFLKNYLLFIFLLPLIFGCSNSDKKGLEKQTGPLIIRDLAEIKKEGKLKALTIYSATSYFLYKGKPMGYEFEMLERFAKHLNVELELIIVKDIDELIDRLNDGTGDVVAHGLTITSLRKEEVAFSDYFYLTHQVLVQKKPDNWLNLHWKKLEDSVIHDAMELLGDTVSVRELSSYNDRILNLSEELGGQIHVKALSGELSTDEIIQMVAEGEIKYTVADDNIASIMASYYPVLDIKVPISFSQRIGWATRQNSNELLNEINAWRKDFKREVDYNVIYNKYFKNKKDFRKRVKSEFYSLNNQEISPYDDLIKKYSKELGWDWRLVSSLIYQESRFDSKNNSWANASGLMQLMPETAKELGVTDRNDPDQNIKGGTRYLKQMWDNFESIQDSVQRTKFTMASYNCGLYHVKDAQNLAEKRGLDSNVWDNNVDEIVLDLSIPKNYQDPVVKYGYVRGIEPYNYVTQIFERYEHYKQFITL